MSMNRVLTELVRIPAVIAVALMTAVATPLVAQESLGIAIVVNDEAITAKDVRERMAMILVLSGIEDTVENHQQLLPQVANMLIDEKLQLQEGARRGMDNYRIDRDETYGFVERTLGLPAGQLIPFMEENNLSLGTLDDQLTAEVVWGELVRARQSRRPIFEEDVDDEHERMLNAAHEPAYLLAEIFLPVDDPTDESRVQENMNRLVEALVSGARFNVLARQFSQSASSINGGDLGWIVRSQLSQELAADVPSLQAGQLSPPIRTLGGYILILVRQVRSGYRVRAEDTEVTIRQAIFPSGEDETADDAALRVADLAGSITTCEELDILAAVDDGPAVSDAITARLTDLQENVRDELVALEEGRAGKPAVIDGGLRVMVLCDRVERGLPSREEARNNLLVRQHDTIARSYLRDLKRRAFVDIRI